MTPWRVRVEPATGEPWERPLSVAPMVIGRAADADLPIADRFLSRHHARIFRDGERLLVEDLGSRNGTRVNDVLLDGPRELAAGDVIQLSGSRLVLIAEPTAERSVDEHPSGVTVYQSASRLLEETSHVHLLSGTLELRRALERLQLLNDVHRALGHSIDTDELLSLILDRAFDHLSPEEGAIYLRDERGEPVRAASRAVAGSTAPPVYSRSLVREVIEKGVAALILDVEQDERFHLSHSLLNAGVRSLAAAPLLDGEDVLGMIVLSSRAAKRHFHEPDLQLLVSLASVAALRLRNVRLAADAAERRVLEQEIDLARRIQTALLPSQLPIVPGWSLHAGTVPSRTVSGDLYQALLRRDGEEMVLVVADVAGKGIGAALLTASFEALAAGPLEDGQPPEEICRLVAARLHHRTPPEKYVTAFLAVLEPGTGRMRWANAGHNPALLLRAGGDIEVLEATGVPLGLLPAVNYAGRDTVLAPGDALLVYTDGVTEATDDGDEEYGLQRLIARCRELQGRTPVALVAGVQDEVAAFADAPPFQDDLTLLAVRRDEPAG